LLPPVVSTFHGSFHGFSYSDYKRVYPLDEIDTFIRAINKLGTDWDEQIDSFIRNACRSVGISVQAPTRDEALALNSLTYTLFRTSSGPIHY